MTDRSGAAFAQERADKANDEVRFWKHLAGAERIRRDVAVSYRDEANESVAILEDSLRELQQECQQLIKASEEIAVQHEKARKESELWRDRFNESDRWRAIEHWELVEAVADIRRLIAENQRLRAEVERLKRSSNIIAGQRNESDRRYFAARAAAAAWKRSAHLHRLAHYDYRQSHEWNHTCTVERETQRELHAAFWRTDRGLYE